MSAEVSSLKCCSHCCYLLDDCEDDGGGGDDYDDCGDRSVEMMTMMSHFAD